MRLATILLDSADPAKLAAFYTAATGWEATYADDDYVFLGDGGPVRLGFQRVAGYQGPGWPDDRKHAHLDFKVPDVAAAVTTLLDLGATKPDFQPDEENWTVLTDPEGHPFCLSTD
ncbi:VOC family protein [Actinosynnema sp. NPDC023658]|uniref:VOC family protein n=1 Tax=Actinosynnema sp. NPDC023658 TaxID=3155465 RepID=UPI0033D92652